MQDASAINTSEGYQIENTDLQRRLSQDRLGVISHDSLYLTSLDQPLIAFIDHFATKLVCHPAHTPCPQEVAWWGLPVWLHFVEFSPHTLFIRQDALEQAYEADVNRDFTKAASRYKIGLQAIEEGLKLNAPESGLGAQYDNSARWKKELNTWQRLALDRSVSAFLPTV